MDIYKKASERIKPLNKSVALPYPFGLSSHIFYQKTKNKESTEADSSKNRLVFVR